MYFKPNQCAHLHFYNHFDKSCSSSITTGCFVQAESCLLSKRSHDTIDRCLIRNRCLWLSVTQIITGYLVKTANRSRVRESLYSSLALALTFYLSHCHQLSCLENTMRSKTQRASTCFLHECYVRAQSRQEGSVHVCTHSHVACQRDLC